MKKNIPWSSVYSFSLAAFLFGLTFLGFTIRWATNDDVFLFLFSSGALNGLPSEFLVLIHFWLGLVLKFLFVNFDVVNWYSLFILLVHFTGTWVIFYYIFKNTHNHFSAIIFSVILFAGVDIFLLLKLQFTSTAIKAAGIGVFVFFQSIYHKNSPPDPKSLLLALFFIMSSILIRSQAFYGVMLLALPIMALHFFFNKRYEVVLFFISAGALALGMDSLQQRYYNNNSGHSQLFAYIRGQEIIQNDPLKITHEALQKVGWSENDFYLMRDSWLFVDKEKYNSESFGALAELTHSPRSTRQAVKVFSYGMFINKRTMFFGFTILFILFLYGNFQARLFLLASSGWLMGIFFYLAMFKRMNERVLLPMLLVLVVFNIYIFLAEKRHYELFKFRRRLIKTSLMAVGLGLALGYQTYALTVINKGNMIIRENFLFAYDDLKAYPDHIFVVPGGNFPYEGMPVITSPNKLYLKNLIPTSWVAQTPAFNAILEFHDISDLMTALYLRPDVLLLNTHETHVTTFLLENYDISATLTSYPGVDSLAFKALKPFSVKVNEAQVVFQEP